MSPHALLQWAFPLFAGISACPPLSAQSDRIHEDLPPYLSSEAIPPRTDLMPARPAPLLEWGDPLLAPGPIQRGHRLFTGTVVQPTLTVFGEHRNAVQSSRSSGQTRTEFVSRLDLFAEWKLSGTERFVFGIRPLGATPASGYVFAPEQESGWANEFSSQPTSLFFEGDIGEMFPGLDREDRASYDIGFAVGRQPLVLQDGLLLNDNVDAFGLTRNTDSFAGIANARFTALWGFDQIHRANRLEDESAHLFGLMTQLDGHRGSLTADALWIEDSNGTADALYAGLGAVRRIGGFDTTLRAVTSQPLHADSPEAQRGTILLAQLARTPKGTEDVAYLNAYGSFRSFTSAARDPAAGGPLGRGSLLFENVGIGTYDSPLGNQLQRSFGAAAGYQFLFDGRHQATFEVGARNEISGPGTGAVAAGVRYQRAFGRRFVVRLDSYVRAEEGDSPSAGVRFEVLTRL